MPIGWQGRYIKPREIFINLMLLYQKKPDIRMFLESLLSLAAVSFFIIFALKPTLVTIAGLWVDIKTKEAIITTMDEKIKNLSLAQAAYTREEARLPIINTAIPDSPQPEVLIRQIEGLASTSDIKISATSIEQIILSKGDPEVSTKDTPSVSFSFNVAGNYTKIFEFLDKFEKLRRPVHLSKCQVGYPTFAENKEIVLVISGETPYLKTNTK